jgi:hypothetical protein
MVLQEKDEDHNMNDNKIVNFQLRHLQLATRTYESSFHWFVTIPLLCYKENWATIFSKLGQHIVIHDPKRNNTSEGTPETPSIRDGARYSSL